MIENLIRATQAYLPDLNVARLEQAYRFAEAAHAGQLRKDGKTPYIAHPLAAALLLTELHVDEDTLIAALLHDVPEDTQSSIEEIEEHFGEEVSFLVKGITKLSKVHYRNDMEERQVDSLKKLFIHTAQDPRVILIKLADRLHNMQTLEAIPNPQKRQRIASETLEIFVPIANLFGVWSLKSQLEDLCFKTLQPEDYAEIKTLVEASSFDKEDFIKKNKQKITDLLRKNAVAFQFVEGREKNYYSIYRKMVHGDKSFSALYDLVGLRIVVNTVGDCYQTLGILHQNFRPKVGRLKDYIAIPKNNGYQGIHTTVFGEDGVIMELQIRTEAMHLENEYGIAAHYFYAKPNQKKKKYVWMQNILSLQKEIQSNADFLKHLKLDIFEDRIFVFTPRGDVIDLPKGATVLDFAYHVHSEIGMLAEGAQVNGKDYGLGHILKSGDVVFVKVSESTKGPQVDWLHQANTSLARNRIREFLKEKDRTSVVEQAEKVLDETLKIFGLHGLAAINEVQRLELIKIYGMKDWESILLGLGQGMISTQDLLLKIYSEDQLLGEAHPSSTGSVHIVCLNVEVEDRLGLLAELSNLFASHGINLIGVHSNRNADSGDYSLKFTLEMGGLDDYQNSIKALGHIEGVHKITRCDIHESNHLNSIDSHKKHAQ